MRRDSTAWTHADKAAKEQAEVVSPLKVGQSWERIAGPTTVKNVVVALETVTINEKTYDNCFHIRSTSADSSVTEDFWEAPKIGSVKSEILYGSGGKISLTLREFKAGR